jgi:hypothetical protein
VPIDPAIVAHAEAVFKSRLRDRRRALARAKAEIMAKAGMKGIGRSGVVVNQILQLCADELRVLAELAWQDFHRAYELLAPPGEQPSAEDFKVAVHAVVDEEFNKVEAFLRDAVQNQGRAVPDLRVELEAAYASLDAELNLYASWKKRMSQRNVRPVPGNVFNIYSPVGAIVTGEHAEVTVQHIIDNREALLHALLQLRDALTQSSEGRAQQSAELLADVESEVRKTRPNPIKVRAAISGIAGAIQTVASLRPAYEFLKPVAALLGIPLP